MFNLAKYLSKPIHDFLNLDKLYKIPTLSIDKIKWCLTIYVSNKLYQYENIIMLCIRY